INPSSAVAAADAGGSSCWGIARRTRWQSRRSGAPSCNWYGARRDVDWCDVPRSSSPRLVATSPKGRLDAYAPSTTHFGDQLLAHCRIGVSGGGAAPIFGIDGARSQTPSDGYQNGAGAWLAELFLQGESLFSRRTDRWAVPIGGEKRYRPFAGRLCHPGVRWPPR